MNAPLNLKELERKAFRSFYQDGIWDIFFGLIMLAMYIFTFFNDMEKKAVGTISLILLEVFAVMFLIYGKKYITVPRLGEVRFGKQRKRRLMYIFLANLLSLIILAGSLGLKIARPDLLDNDQITTIGLGIWITFLTSIMAYFLDFNRLYIYALIYGATFAVVLLFDVPILFLAAALLILLPGIIIFTHFLMTTKPVEGA
ncbi:MAG: hypothetical protein PVI99_08935 [Anaerolineales bacterium]|jgi:hypothetical protein